MFASDGTGTSPRPSGAAHLGCDKPNTTGSCCSQATKHPKEAGQGLWTLGSVTEVGSQGEPAPPSSPPWGRKEAAGEETGLQGTSGWAKGERGRGVGLRENLQQAEEGDASLAPPDGGRLDGTRVLATGGQVSVALMGHWPDPARCLFTFWGSRGCGKAEEPAGATSSPLQSAPWQGRAQQSKGRVPSPRSKAGCGWGALAGGLLVLPVLLFCCSQRDLLAIVGKQDAGQDGSLV